MNKFLFILLFFNTFCFAQKDFGLSSTKFSKIENYKFLFSGHLYGAPENKNSKFPASSILANIEKLNKSQAEFFISAGDNFRYADSLNINNFFDSFINKLSFPFYNSVGNHDISNRRLYENFFGPTFFYFNRGNDYYIFLDSEKNTEIQQNEQLVFFNNTIDKIQLSQDVRNVFIISHKLIWSNIISDYENVYDGVNSKVGYENQKDFANKILKKLTDLKGCEIFWLSGDIGVSWSLPIFFHNNKNLNISFLANGLGDVEADCIIEVSVKSDSVIFSAIPLSQNILINILDFDLNKWNQDFKYEKTFLDYHKHITNIIISYQFLIGMIIGMIIIYKLKSFIFD